MGQHAEPEKTAEPVESGIFHSFTSLLVRRAHVRELLLLFIFLTLGAGFLGHTLSEKNRLLEEDTQRISLNYQMIDLISKLQGLPGEMVANQGTYLLTGQRLYFTKYSVNKKEFSDTLDFLEKMAAGNPLEEKEVENLRKKFKSFCRRLESGTRSYRRMLFHFEATAAKTLATVRADQAAIAASAQKMLDEERRSLSSRVLSLEEQKQEYYHILFFGLAGMPMMIFIFIGVFLYTNARRIKAELLLRAAEERHLRALELSNKQLEDFSYIVSHDLKEPLRGLQTFSKFLLEDYGDKLGESGKAKLTTISDITQRMEKFLYALLDYSRLGRTDLAIQETDLNQAVQDVIGMYAITLKEKNIDVVITQKLPTIRCDFIRITEVFQNLIGNAIKYNDKPRNRIEVGYTGTHPQAPGERAFFVKDNGIGVNKDHLDVIFQIFKRLHPKGAYGGGTGSGLAITKQLIEQHGGRIWAESEGKGKGTTFFFTIPAPQKTAPGGEPDAV